MRKFLLIALFLLSAAAQAAPGDFVVKVLSGPCGTRRAQKIGSGNLLRMNGAVYVLSSDHVLFHGGRENKICHFVQKDGVSLPAELVAVNVFKGLSLLSLKNGERIVSDGDDIVDLGSLSLTGPSSLNGSFGSLVGVPYTASGALHGNNAQVLSARSNRKILPGVDSVYEVKGHSEFGMSGGAFLDSRGQFHGLLSHQYLRLHLGAPSTLHDYEESGSDGEMIALVIPLPDILEWLSAVRLGAPNADLRLDVSEQLKRKESLVVEGVRFSVQRCDANGGAVGGSAQGGEGAGIGGRRAGGEGAGIGGEDDASAKPVCAILATLARNSDGNSGNTELSRTVWFQQLKGKLESGSSARLTGLFRDGVRYELIGLVPFFAQLQRGMMPLIEVQSPFVVEKESVQRLSKLSQEALKNLSGLLSDTRLEADAADTLGELSLFLKALQNGQLEFVSTERLQELIAADAWTDLMQLDFSRSVALKSKLLQIQEELRRIRI